MRTEPSQTKMPVTHEEFLALWDAFWEPEERRMKDFKFSEERITMLKTFGQLCYAEGMQQMAEITLSEVKKLKDIIDPNGEMEKAPLSETEVAEESSNQ